MKAFGWEGCSSSLILPRRKERGRATTGNHQAHTCHRQSGPTCSARQERTTGGSLEGPGAASWLAVPGGANESERYLHPPPDSTLSPQPSLTAAPPQEAAHPLPLQSLHLLARAQAAPGGSGCPQVLQGCSSALGASRALGLLFSCFVPNAHWRVTSSPIPAADAGPKPWESQSHEVQRKGISHTKNLC